MRMPRVSRSKACVSLRKAQEFTPAEAMVLLVVVFSLVAGVVYVLYCLFNAVTAKKEVASGKRGANRSKVEHTEKLQIVAPSPCVRSKNFRPRDAKGRFVKK